MKKINIKIAIFNDGNIRCDQWTLLNNLLGGIIFPEKVDYIVHYNGPHDIPWGEREESSLKALKAEMKDIPTTQGEWAGKYISLWVTL